MSLSRPSSPGYIDNLNVPSGTCGPCVQRNFLIFHVHSYILLSRFSFFISLYVTMHEEIDT